MNQLLKAIDLMQAEADHIDPQIIAAAMVASLIASLAAGAMYRLFYEHRGTGSQVHRAFPLLGTSITALFVCIQTSLPLSLGLLGALSIIRFRTPIKEPEEVGFIMLVIASSIACATFNLNVLIILFAISMVTLMAIRFLHAESFVGRDGLIVLTLPADADPEQLQSVLDLLNRRVRRGRVESSSSRDDQHSLQFSFSGLKGEFGDMQSQLRETTPVQSVNIFFSRPGGFR